MHQFFGQHETRCWSMSRELSSLLSCNRTMWEWIHSRNYLWRFPQGFCVSEMYMALLYKQIHICKWCFLLQTFYFWYFRVWRCLVNSILWFSWLAQNFSSLFFKYFRLTNLVPLSRAGHFRFMTDFSGPLNTSLTVVFFLEYSSFITVSSSGQVEKSYTV